MDYDPAGLSRGIGAVGVMMVSRKLWFQLQGYDEAMTGWGHMEVELFSRAKNITSASEATGLVDLYPAIHIYHDRLRQSRPINAWIQTIRRIDNPSFGFGLQDLPEATYGIRC